MAGRWFVHRNDQQLGPYRPDEIRQGLRDGHFDPFDLISREGSHVRVELMEIDEIFMHSQIEYVPSAEDQAGAHSLDQVAGGGGGAFIGGAAAEVNPRQRMALAQGAQQPAQAPEAKRGAKRGKPESPKRFFLVEANGRITGPMAASEIQAAWARGGLESSLMVQKNNSSAKVPIAKFVHLYAMAKLSGAPGGATQVTSPMLSNLIRTEADRRGQMRRWLLPGLGVLVLGLAIAVAVVFFRSAHPRKPTRNPNAVRRPVPAQVTPPQSPTRRPLQTLPSTRRSPRRALPPPNSSVNKAAPKPLPAPLSVNQPPTTWKRPPTRKSKNTPPQTVAPQVPRAPVVRPAPAPAARVQPVPAPVTAPVQAPVAAPPPAPAPAPAQAPVAGGVGSIAGATFNKADLDACAMKCKIKFTAKGEQITVVFFKGAFEDQLKGRKGPVTLSGKIDQVPGSGKTMYLQQVK